MTSSETQRARAIRSPLPMSTPAIPMRHVRFIEGAVPGSGAYVFALGLVVVDDEEGQRWEAVLTKVVRPKSGGPVVEPIACWGTGVYEEAMAVLVRAVRKCGPVGTPPKVRPAGRAILLTLPLSQAERAALGTPVFGFKGGAR